MHTQVKRVILTESDAYHGAQLSAVADHDGKK